MFTFGTTAVTVLKVFVKGGIAIAIVTFQNGAKVETVEYRIEGCADLGNNYVSREGFTTVWRRDGGSVADRISTKVCKGIEDAQLDM